MQMANGSSDPMFERWDKLDAKDGGFMLQNRAVLDDVKAENLKAMIDAGRAWRA